MQTPSAAARTLCRFPRLVKINTIAFRRATNLCGTSWEPGIASKRQRSLKPHWKTSRGYLIRTMPRGPFNSHIGE